MYVDLSPRMHKTAPGEWYSDSWERGKGKEGMGDAHAVKMAGFGVLMTTQE